MNLVRLTRHRLIIVAAIRGVAKKGDGLIWLLTILFQTSADFIQILRRRAVKKIEAAMLRDFRDNGKLAVVPLISFHSPFYREQKLRFNLANNLVSQFEG